MARFFVIALATLVGSACASNPFNTNLPKSSNSFKGKMMSELLSEARPTENSQLSRGLEEADIDLSGYEIKFEKCQFVRSYDDELAEDEDASSVLSTKRFVVFRLCPADTCGSCNQDYGEYVVDLESYLEIATEYFVNDRDNMCNACNQICQADDDAAKSADIDCDECYDYCLSVGNMENNGYIESYQFAQCIQVSDNGNTQRYAGAMCSDNGSYIKIGAFSDEECSTYDDVNIENYLQNGVKFNDDILEKTANSKSCVSCTMNNYGGDDDAVNEMCLNLYDMSAKCESKYGFDNYWKNNEEYVNQYLQEDLVCDFIASLNNGNYDQYGEIVLSGSRRTGSGGSTASQKFFLSVFVLGSIGLGVYSSRIQALLRQGAKADLSSQGGAMA